MELEQKIMTDIKAAMKEKNKEKLEALRAVKSAILLAKTEKGKSSNLDTESELKLLQKLVKQRIDSAEIYREQNRNDLAEKERFEASIISKYLPAQLSESDIETAIQRIIEETNASSMADMGKVMGMASKELSGKADGKTIAGIVKNLLS